MKVWSVAAIVVLGQLFSGEVLAERYRVNDKEFEVSAALETPEVMVGEPCRVLFTVKNLSDRPMVAIIRTTAGASRPVEYDIQVVNSKGQPVTPIPYMGIPGGCPVGGETLAPRAEASYHLFLPYWVKLEKVGEYRVTVSRKLPVILDFIPGKANQAVHSVDVKCTTTMKVVPSDPVKLGKVIQKWGPLMLGSDAVEYNERQWANQMMAGINDERVIPYYANLAKSDNYMCRIYTTWAIERFPSDRALDILKELATTQGADCLGMFEAGTPAEAGANYAKQVRYAAARALTNSSHPKALATLLGLAEHPRDDVRWTVLERASQVKSPEARAVIRKLMKDPDDAVRSEAWRYFRQDSAGKGEEPPMLQSGVIGTPFFRPPPPPPPTPPG